MVASHKGGDGGINLWWHHTWVMMVASIYVNNSCQVPANLVVVVAWLFCCSGAPQANCIQENLKESKLFLYNFECVFLVRQVDLSLRSVDRNALIYCSNEFSAQDLMPCDVIVYSQMCVRRTATYPHLCILNAL